jgi:hypothetical protein
MNQSVEILLRIRRASGASGRLRNPARRDYPRDKECATCNNKGTTLAQHDFHNKHRGASSWRDRRSGVIAIAINKKSVRFNNAAENEKTLD